jgi:hypothetical protein
VDISADVADRAQLLVAQGSVCVTALGSALVADGNELHNVTATVSGICCTCSDRVGCAHGAAALVGWIAVYWPLTDPMPWAGVPVWMLSSAASTRRTHGMTRTWADVAAVEPEPAQARGRHLIGTPRLHVSPTV